MCYGAGDIRMFFGQFDKISIGEHIVPRHSMGKYVGIYRDLSGLGPELYHPAE